MTTLMHKSLCSYKIPGYTIEVYPDCQGGYCVLETKDALSTGSYFPTQEAALDHYSTLIEERGHPS